MRVEFLVDGRLLRRFIESNAMAFYRRIMTY